MFAVLVGDGPDAVAVWELVSFCCVGGYDEAALVWRLLSSGSEAFESHGKDVCGFAEDGWVVWIDLGVDGVQAVFRGSTGLTDHGC